MKIEQREQQESFPLGTRWPPGVIKTIGTRTRIAGYENGVAIEIDGDTWEFETVQSAEAKFRNAPGG